MSHDLISWKDEYESGIDSIDKDHYRLIQKVNEIIFEHEKRGIAC
jgi:hemerythrin